MLAIRGVGAVGIAVEQAVAAVGFAVVLAEHAMAVEPHDRCTVQKLRAVSRALGPRYRCEVKGITEPATAGAFCQEAGTRAGNRLAAEVDAADEIAPCPGAARHLQPIAFAECVPYVTGDGECAVAKLRAARAAARAKLRCHVHAVRAGAPPNPTCIDQADAHLADAFDAADLLGQCGGAAAQVGEILDRCVGRVRVALSCGDGAIDTGEECDGQRFCSVPDCQIRDDPRCCEVANLCFATPQALEGCHVYGGSVTAGYCPNEPCPEGAPPGCTKGACSDPPIPSTTACCRNDDACEETVAQTTLELREAMRACALAGGTNAIGACCPEARRAIRRLPTTVRGGAN